MIAVSDTHIRVSRNDLYMGERTFQVWGRFQLEYRCLPFHAAWRAEMIPRKACVINMNR